MTDPVDPLELTALTPDLAAGPYPRQYARALKGIGRRLTFTGTVLDVRLPTGQDGPGSGFLVVLDLDGPLEDVLNPGETEETQP